MARPSIVTRRTSARSCQDYQATTGAWSAGCSHESSLDEREHSHQLSYALRRLSKTTNSTDSFTTRCVTATDCPASATVHLPVTRPRAAFATVGRRRSLASGLSAQFHGRAGAHLPTEADPAADPVMPRRAVRPTPRRRRRTPLDSSPHTRGSSARSRMVWATFN